MTDSSTAPKQKKGGLKKLWVRVKTIIWLNSSEPQTKSHETIQSKQKEQSSIPPPPVSQPTIVDESPPVPEAEVVKEMEMPEAKVCSVPEEAIVEKDSKAIIPALDAIEVDDTEDLPDVYVDGSASRHATNPNRYQLPAFVQRSSESVNKKKFDQAQAVYEKYGIPLNITDWQRSEKPGVERVEKKARMRVRYTCHSCQTTFGRDKICTKCSHDRGKCTECVRYPVKRTGDKPRRQKIVLVEPTVPPIDKGACHECKTDFSIGDKCCPNCEHEICERCLRETVLTSPATAPPTESRSVTAISA